METKKLTKYNIVVPAPPCWIVKIHLISIFPFSKKILQRGNLSGPFCIYTYEGKRWIIA